MRPHNLGYGVISDAIGKEVVLRLSTESSLSFGIGGLIGGIVKNQSRSISGKSIRRERLARYRSFSRQEAQRLDALKFKSPRVLARWARQDMPWGWCATSLMTVSIVPPAVNLVPPTETYPWWDCAPVIVDKVRWQ